MSADEFHRYHPLRWRLAIGVAALAALGLTVWAATAALNSESSLELARAGLSAGIFAALMTLSFRLRPRSNWGVRLSPAMLSISRPIEGHIDVDWADVREVHRAGAKRNVLLLTLNDARHISLPEHLFAGRKDFELLVAAIEERLPPTPFDA